MSEGQDIFDLMEARCLADEILRTRSGARVLRKAVDKLANGFQLCDSQRAQAFQQFQEIKYQVERTFQEGCLAAEEDDDGRSPYEEGSLSDHWWTRGYAYVKRLLRAIEAEQRNDAAQVLARKLQDQINELKIELKKAGL